MTDQLTHPYTGIPLSKTFLKSMEFARVDIEELPDTVDDCDGEINEAQAQIELMDQQIELEAAGATRRSSGDPDWPSKVTHARRYVTLRRGILVRWRKRLRHAEEVKEAKNPPSAIPAQLRNEYQQGIERRIDHYKLKVREIDACMRALKSVVRRLDEASRTEVYAEIDKASATLDKIRDMKESGQTLPTLDDAEEADLPDGFWEAALPRPARESGV